MSLYPKLASKICPEESQAESMKTVPLGPAIPSSDFNKANSQVANLVRSPQEKNEIKVWCPVDVKASLSHMICWNKWRVWGSWEIHSFKNAPSTSSFIQHLCRTAVVSLLNPIVPQPPQPWPPHWGARALRPSSPKKLKVRSTLVTLLLTRKALARACRAGTTHTAEWTAAAALCIVN